MKINRKTGWLLLGAMALLAALTPAAASAAGSNAAGDTQPGQGPGTITTPGAAPDSCLHLKQLNADEQKYRTVNNVAWTYTSGVYGANWFDVACGDLNFTVPAGQQALVDLLAVAELDCQGPAGANSWCGGRWLVNGQPLPLPNNTGRPDSYAWDSANGGVEDWQANTLAQEYVATCTTTATACTYRVQLQSQLANGATSVWIDDLTTRVDVSEGPVFVAAGPTTP
jgi:hypothetical protein